MLIQMSCPKPCASNISAQHDFTVTIGVTVLSHNHFIYLDCEVRALTLLAGSLNAAALVLPNTFGHGKPDADTVITGILSFVKSIEYMRQIILVDALTVIKYVDHGINRGCFKVNTDLSAAIRLRYPDNSFNCLYLQLVKNQETASIKSRAKHAVIPAMVSKKKQAIVPMITTATKKVIYIFISLFRSMSIAHLISHPAYPNYRLFQGWLNRRVLLSSNTTIYVVS